MKHIAPHCACLNSSRGQTVQQGQLANPEDNHNCQSSEDGPQLAPYAEAKEEVPAQDKILRISVDMSNSC